MTKLVCPKCGSKQIEPAEDKFFKLGRETQKYICKNCGELTSLVVERKGEITPEMKGDLDKVLKSSKTSPKKTKGKRLPWGKILVIAIVLLISFFLIQNYLNRVTPGHYDNELYGISFDYPPLWHSSASNRIASFTNSEKTAGFFIDFDKLEANDTVKSLFEGHISAIENNASVFTEYGYDYGTLIQTKEPIVDGRQVYMYTAETYSNLQGSMGKYTTYYLPVEGGVIYLTYYAPKIQYDSYLDEFTVVINSLELS